MQSLWLSRNGFSKAALHAAARTVAITVLLLYGSTAQASERESTAVSLPTGGSSDESALRSIAGDVNGDGLVDLKDAVIGLQVCAGTTPTDALSLSGDVNSDGKIGLPEAVNALQNAAYPPSIETMPVLMIQGFGNTGIYSWSENLVPYLKERGWTDDQLYFPDMPVDNRLMCSANHITVVASWINDALADHSSQDIAVVAHSRGGLNIMQTLWQGAVDVSRIRYVIIQSGMVNWDCGDTFPPHPADETPDTALYTTMYSDGPDDCDLTGDDRTSAELAYVEGADASINLHPLCHWEVHKDPVALAWILQALQGLIGSN